MTPSTSIFDDSINEQKEKIIGDAVKQNEAIYLALQENNEKVKDRSSPLYVSRGNISDEVMMQGVSNFLILLISTMS